MTCGAAKDGTLIIWPKKGLDVTAVDLSRSALARAKELCKSAKAHPHFILADITNLPLNGAYYDLAVNIACLRMTTNQFKRRKHLSETSRILKSSGLYFSCNGGVKRQTPPDRFYDKLGERPGTLIPRKIKVQGVEKTIHLPIIAAWLKSRIPLSYL